MALKKLYEDGLNYVDRVRENTRNYVEELLRENENLLKRLETIEGERVKLANRLVETQMELDQESEEGKLLKRRFEEMQDEHQRLSEGYTRVEEENNNLATLYVATYSLHGSLDAQGVLAAIQEIVINLVGSEELAIFEVDPDGENLVLISSIGIDTAGLETIPMGTGLIGRAASTGKPYFADGQRSDRARAEEEGLTACVPLTIGNRVTGALAVFRLLKQKPGVEPLDLELFDLLASQAATALYCTKLHGDLVSE